MFNCDRLKCLCAVFSFVFFPLFIFFFPYSQLNSQLISVRILVITFLFSSSPSLWLFYSTRPIRINANVIAIFKAVSFCSKHHTQSQNLESTENNYSNRIHSYVFALWSICTNRFQNNQCYSFSIIIRPNESSEQKTNTAHTNVYYIDMYATLAIYS